MCCRGKSGARASSPHGARLTHVQGFRPPDGLSGETIPLLARIIAVADAFESMTSNRVYRTRVPNAEAIRRLQECAGTHFDARIVETFAALHEEGFVW